MSLAEKPHAPSDSTLSAARGGPDEAARPGALQHEPEGERDRRARRHGAGADQAERVLEALRTAIDLVRRRQQFAERPAPHHVGPAGRVEPVGRVGLAALELADRKRAGIACDMIGHPPIELSAIDGRPRSASGRLCHGTGAGRICHR